MCDRRQPGWWFCCLLALLLLGYPSDAAAYIDPGTGSLAYQTLIGLMLGAIVFLRHIWARIRGRASRDISPGEVTKN